MSHSRSRSRIPKKQPKSARAPVIYPLKNTKSGREILKKRQLERRQLEKRKRGTGSGSGAAGALTGSKRERERERERDRRERRSGSSCRSGGGRERSRSRVEDADEDADDGTDGPARKRRRINSRPRQRPQEQEQRERDRPTMTRTPVIPYPKTKTNPNPNPRPQSTSASVREEGEGEGEGERKYSDCEIHQRFYTPPKPNALTSPIPPTDRGIQCLVRKGSGYAHLTSQSFLSSDQKATFDELRIQRQRADLVTYDDLEGTFSGLDYETSCGFGFEVVSSYRTDEGLRLLAALRAVGRIMFSKAPTLMKGEPSPTEYVLNVLKGVNGDLGVNGRQRTHLLLRMRKEARIEKGQTEYHDFLKFERFLFKRKGGRFLACNDKVVPFPARQQRSLVDLRSWKFVVFQPQPDRLGSWSGVDLGDGRIETSIFLLVVEDLQLRQKTTTTTQ